MKYRKQRQLDKNGYAKKYILEDKEGNQVQADCLTLFHMKNIKDISYNSWHKSLVSRGVWSHGYKLNKIVGFLNSR
tara:strand:- start:33 stop:260 length:228 start_codon:yes stop_codon:yes gene_type:complete